MMKQKIQLSDYEVDETYEFVAKNSTDPWISDILNELEADIDKSEPFKKGKLEISFEVLRRVAKPLADHLTIKGYFEADYQTPCVRCLKLTDQHIESDIFGAWVNESLMKLPEFEDECFRINGHEYDLYTLDKGAIDLKEFIHEQVFMNVPFLPLHDENCKGLCQKCGVNLNETSCSHQSEMDSPQH